MKTQLKSLASLLLFAGVGFIAACGGGGGGSGGGGGGGVIPVPTSPPTPQVGLTCLNNGVFTNSSVRSTTDAMLRYDNISRSVQSAYVPDEIAVQYDRQTFAALRGQQSVGGAPVVRDIEFDAIGKVTRILRVDPSQVDATLSTLRRSSGVLRADRVAYRSLQLATALPVNDPYFATPVTPSNPTPPGAPYYESSTVPGQWDMHVIAVANAWGYSTTPNGTGVAHPLALGDPNVKVAIIDTGVDVTHPEFAGKVGRTRCFINGTSSSDVTDFDGHGSNVAGIVASKQNNSFAVVGVGGNVSLMGYRIFPSGSNSQANSSDEALAINDAVANGASVINLSLGSSSSDPTEQAAINNALSNKVIVVAASGNETKGSVDYPGAYPGVIAVGASALNDSNPASIFEYVAAYSNYGGTNTFRSTSSWGIVAPGGDPTGGSDNDELHWIRNTYSSAASPNNCTKLDFYGESGNCRIDIAGTSQATPHVAGAVALLESVLGARSQTPAQMFALLCGSTDNLNNDPKQGCGRLNIYRAMAHALNDPAAP